MKKIKNNKENLVSEMINGFVYAHHEEVEISKLSSQVICRKKKKKGKVGVVIGGGSGHEPMFLGYLGEGLADAVAIGNVFSAPTPQTIKAAINEADQGSGVICIFGNYAGDVLNFEFAKELVEIESNITVINVPVTDDIASDTVKKDRRGIAGDLIVIKQVGAAAKLGYSLYECSRVANLANSRLFSLGVGISPGTNPVNGQPNFELAEGLVEFGLGIHGEPGISQMSSMSSEELSKHLLSILKEEIEKEYEMQEVIVLINGLGSTTLMELFIINNDLHHLLQESSCQIVSNLVGNYCTTQEMAGFSITIQICTEELIKLQSEAAFGSYYFHMGG